MNTSDKPLNTVGILSLVESGLAERICVIIEKDFTITEHRFYRAEISRDNHPHKVWERTTIVVKTNLCQVISSISTDSTKNIEDDILIAFLDDVCSDHNRHQFRATVFINKKNGTPLQYQ